MLLNERFESAGEVETGVGFDPGDISEAAVHQVVKAALAARRGGNAQTKNRAAVRGGGAKPHRQKGTGRARQGSIRAPNHVGGGTVFGPARRSHAQKVNKRMALRALHSVLVDKFQAGKLSVVERVESDGRTRGLFALLNDRNLLPALVVTGSKDSPVLRAARNLARGRALWVGRFSVYEAVRHENLVIERRAFESLLERLGG